MLKKVKACQMRQWIVLFLIFGLVLSSVPDTVLGMVNDWKVGDKAYFKNGPELRGGDGKPYYNYHTTGHRYAYCITPVKGGKTIKGYCLERNLDNPQNGSTKYYAATWDTALRIKDYSQQVQQALKVALLYGRPPLATMEGLQNLLGRYGNHLEDCNLDDWWIATQTIIWEFTDGYRKSLEHIPEDVGQVKNGKTVLGTINPQGGEGNDFHYRILKGRPARHMYFAMLRAMKKHSMIPSFAAREKSSAKTIYMEKTVSKSGKVIWRSVNPAYRKQMTAEAREAARQRADYNVLKDGNRCGQDLQVVKKQNGKLQAQKDFQIMQKSGGYILEYQGETLPQTVQHGKKDVPKATTDELLVWQNSPTERPLQTVAIGAEDPVDFYFKLRAIPEDGTLEDGEEPALPAFTFDTEKRDASSGFDGGEDGMHTGMGDAALDSEISLYLNGVLHDTRQLTIFGGTEGNPFIFTPWTEVSALDYEEKQTVDEEGLLHTDYYWRGQTSVMTKETKVPAGRHAECAEKGGGMRDHGTIVYYAHRRDSGRITYRITYEGEDGNGAVLTEPSDIDIENPQNMRSEIGAYAYTNDHFRGDLQLVKTKDDQDPFTDETGGKKTYSTNSKWTIRLESGGWENCPYIRVLEQGIETGTDQHNIHNYAVTQDNSGVPADAAHPLTLSKHGQLYVRGLPYGTYIVEEIAADQAGYVLESFRVTISEDGQIESVSVHNRQKRNRIKIIKTNAETGKTVRWDADRTAFQIRYLGNPDAAEPEKSPNYGKWLPNGTGYKDKGQGYVFYAGHNGEIVLPYELEYGMYEIRELVVPKGYFVGQFDGTGKGTMAEMGEVKILNHKGQCVTPPKDFLELVQVRDGEKKPVMHFSGNGETTYNSYRFSVLEQSPHEDGKDYTTYYAVLEMANQPVKGKLQITKTGEQLTSWKEENGLWHAVWGKTALKHAKFAIYAAEDVMQADGVIPVTAYETESGQMVKLKKTHRDHAGVSLAKEQWEKQLFDGSTILRVSDKGVGNALGTANQTITEYQVKNADGASYSDVFSVRDETEKMTWRYQVSYRIHYAKGGFYYTDVHLRKDSVSDDYTAAIAVTDPVLKNDGESVGITTMAYENGNRVRVNPLAGEAGKPEEDVTGIFCGYNTADIIAKPVPRDEREEADILLQFSALLPTGFHMLQGEQYYLASDGKGAYRILISEGLAKRWIPCDEKGNYYKSYTQEYDFTLAQHAKSPAGFSLTWDTGIEMTTAADHEKETAVTRIACAENRNPKIETSSGYTYQKRKAEVVLTAMPQETAPVYFLTYDGIRTQMYLSGGLTHTQITVTQAQLQQFETMLPNVTYRGTPIPWYDRLHPDEEQFEQIFDQDNYIRVQRHLPTEEHRTVFYTIDLVSDAADQKHGFQVTYPDTTTAFSSIIDGGHRAVLQFCACDGTMVYPAGQPVGVMETGEDGIAESELLPLGTYWVREISSAQGHVNGGQWKQMELRYKDQYTPLIWETAAYDNEAVSVKIDLEKAFETDYRSGMYQVGSGAVFGIFTADTPGILPDTKVGTMTVTEGQASATVKLPAGKYYIKETSTPRGYALNPARYYFDAVDLLTADRFSFSYGKLGVDGTITQDGKNGVVIDFDMLYRTKPAAVVIDGKPYAMDQCAAEGFLQIAVMDGRTNCNMQVKDGKTAEIRWENDAVMTVSSVKDTYQVKLEGDMPEFETGKEGDDTHFTITQADGTTVVSYTPKVTRTNWLTTVTDARSQKEKQTGAFTVSAPGDTSAISVQTEKDCQAVQIALLQGMVCNMIVDGEPIENPQLPLDLQSGQQAMLACADGVTYEVELDLNGRLSIHVGGACDGEESTACAVTFRETADKDDDHTHVASGFLQADDEKVSLPDGIFVKHTTAKTYARNHSDAPVVHIRVSGVKNDRLPEKPAEPEKPTIPEKPEKPEHPKKGMLSLIKVDSAHKKPLPGAAFTVWDDKGTLVHSGVTDQDGRLRVQNLAPGVYSYREVKAPAGYIADDTTYTFCITEKGNTVEAIVPNRMKKKTNVGVEFPGEPATNETKIPMTGDTSSILIYVVLLVMATCGMAAAIRRCK